MAALGGTADLVLSDMAPNTTGHGATDHLRIMALAELALDFALKCSAPGGGFVAKVFQGGGEGGFLELLKRNFRARAPRQAAGQPQGQQRALRGRHRLPRRARADRRADACDAAAIGAKGRRQGSASRPNAEGSPWLPNPCRTPCRHRRRRGRPHRHRRGLRLRRRAAHARLFGGAAAPDRHPHPPHPRDRAQHPARRRGDGHRDRGAAWPSPWPRRAASASSTRTCRPRTRPRRCAG